MIPQNDERETLLVEKKEVDEAFFGLLKIFTEGVEVVCLQCDAGFELDVGRSVAVSEKPPAGGFEQSVDFDAGGNFFHSSNT